MENNNFIAIAGILVLLIITLLLVPTFLAKSQREVTSVQVCSTHTVQPVMCRITESANGIPKKFGVQMAEPYYAPEGELYSVRASIGANYADLKKGDSRWPKEKGAILTVEITQNKNDTWPSTPQVRVDSSYILPSGSSTSCASVYMTCTN